MLLRQGVALEPATTRGSDDVIDQRELRGHPERVVQLPLAPGNPAVTSALNVLRAPISTALLLRRTNTPALRRSTAAAGALAARSTRHSRRWSAACWS